MRIVLAPDKFKGSLTANEVCNAIASGLRRVDRAVEIDECPVADGGEGFVAAMVTATGGQFVRRTVTGPLPEMRIDATFGILGDRETAVIEMAAASGLALLKPADRNPMYTTTFGTGELIVAAVELGAKNILLGIGGSATNDGGIGCAQACGHTIVLEDGEPASATEPLVGADVARVVIVKRHRGEKTDRVKITVACDVNNPLFGTNGASAVFGPQKGASSDQVKQLDLMLRQLATRNNALDIARVPGAGAAGGLGFGMMAFFGAELRSGIDIVLEATRLRERLKHADLCITGEGRLDAQSADGKAVSGVAKFCGESNVPCVAIAGAVDPGFALSGVTAAFSICNEPMPLDRAISDAGLLLESTAAAAFRLFAAHSSRR